MGGGCLFRALGYTMCPVFNLLLRDSALPLSGTLLVLPSSHATSLHTLSHCVAAPRCLPRLLVPSPHTHLGLPCTLHSCTHAHSLPPPPLTPPLTPPLDPPCMQRLRESLGAHTSRHTPRPYVLSPLPPNPHDPPPHLPLPPAPRAPSPSHALSPTPLPGTVPAPPFERTHQGRAPGTSLQDAPRVAPGVPRVPPWRSCSGGGARRGAW